MIRDLARLFLYLFIIIYVTNLINKAINKGNHRGGGFMNGWTSQTDRAFYQMQYLTGHETDEMKMVLASCLGCFVISWLVNKALNLVTTVTQFIFLIVPITVGLLWYVDIITVDATGIRYRHDRLLRDLSDLTKNYPSVDTIKPYLKSYWKTFFNSLGDFCHQIGDFFH